MNTLRLYSIHSERKIDQVQSQLCSFFPRFVLLQRRRYGLLQPLDVMMDWAAALQLLMTPWQEC